MYVCMYVCMHVCMYAYIYIYTIIFQYLLAEAYIISKHIFKVLLINLR